MITEGSKLHFLELSSLVIKANDEEAKKFGDCLRLHSEDLEMVLTLLQTILTDPATGRVFIYRDDNKIKGFVTGYLRGKRGFIQDIWLEESIRGTPICIRLFQKIMDWFASQNVAAVACSCAVENTPVHYLLEKTGFEAVSMNYVKEGV